MAGIGPVSLLSHVLPVLKRADVIDYTTTEGLLTSIEEYVGITGTMVEQAYNVLTHLNPTRAELALLHSVEVASWAPLTESHHKNELARRGFDDLTSHQGYRLSLSAGVNSRVTSSELGEQVVFNPYVWGSGQIPIAKFLQSLPTAEREALLGLCEQASHRPGLALSAVDASPRALKSARKVGLIQATTVKSTAGRGASQTYVFLSPA